MLTAEQNELLTRVGPGTPAGELLRRYWHPVAIASDLSAENPTKFVRILGEELVLFRTPKGEAELLEDRCRIAALRFATAEWRTAALPVPIMAGSTIFGAIVLKHRPSRREPKMRVAAENLAPRSRNPISESRKACPERCRRDAKAQSSEFKNEVI
jgi:hypothetical protein